MKHVLRLVKMAKPYWWLLIITGFSLLVITGLNLIAPYLIMRLLDILTELTVRPEPLTEVRTLALT